MALPGGEAGRSRTQEIGADLRYVHFFARPSELTLFVDRQAAHVHLLAHQVLDRSC